VEQVSLKGKVHHIIPKKMCSTVKNGGKNSSSEGWGIGKGCLNSMNREGAIAGKGCNCGGGASWGKIVGGLVEIMVIYSLTKLLTLTKVTFSVVACGKGGGVEKGMLTFSLNSRKGWTAKNLE